MSVEVRILMAAVMVAGAGGVAAQPAPAQPSPAVAPQAVAAATPAAPAPLALPRPGTDVLRDLLEAEMLTLERKAREALAAAKDASKPPSTTAVAALSEPIVLEPPPTLLAIEGPAGVLVARLQIGNRTATASLAQPQVGDSGWRLESLQPGRAVVVRDTPAKGKDPGRTDRVQLALALPIVGGPALPTPTRPVGLPGPIPSVQPTPPGAFVPPARLGAPTQPPPITVPGQRQ